MDALTLQQVKQHDISTQYLIFGFIRNAQLLLPKSSSYWNITDLIIYAVMAFYQHVEYFKYYDHAAFKTTDEDRTITKVSQSSERSIYGSQTIHFGVHCWEFKINRISPDINCVIGIDEGDHKWTHTRFWSKSGNHYAYACWGNKIEGSNQQNGYGDYYVSGDIIKMILDLNQKTLSFERNEGGLNKAFTINDCDEGYSLAIWLYNHNDSITISSYNNNYKDK